MVFVQMNPQTDRPPYSESCKDTEKPCYGQSHPSGGSVDELPPSKSHSLSCARHSKDGGGKHQHINTNPPARLKTIPVSKYRRRVKDKQGKWRLPGTGAAKSIVPTSVGDGTAHEGAHSDKTDLMA